MGSYYLANKQPDLVTGFVGIGMSGGGKIPEMDNVELLKSLQVPVLDIYGENDLNSVLSSASDRIQSIENNKVSTSELMSRQIMIPGADHFFDGQNADLLNEVSTWLKQL